MRLVRWLRRHPLLGVIAGVGLCALAYGLRWWYWPSMPTMSAAKVQSVDIYLTPIKLAAGVDPGIGQDEFRITITDQSQIRALLDVFATAERASEHKCANCGTIHIHRHDGTM
jgi:hypothetical protein